ncbi:uncharacterized protein [Palaemon carinicauda]|uniref:uncharacterized protein n=1 Tax=Palaemon carinicauda TaxID=392227 RepID=UPI0035B694DE
MTRCSLSKSANIRLVAANGSAIPTTSYEFLALSFGSTKYNWKFLVAEVTSPMLGADFLSHFQLLVDVAHRWLVNSDSYSSTTFQPDPSDLALHISVPTDAYTHLLRSYQEVFRPELCQMPTVSAKHGIYHHIRTMGPPVFARFRHLAQDCLAAPKQMFAEMEEMSLCPKASSSWLSHLHIVLKKGGSLRLCGDYRCLNM